MNCEYCDEPLNLEDALVDCGSTVALYSYGTCENTTCPGHAVDCSDCGEMLLSTDDIWEDEQGVEFCANCIVKEVAA